MEARDSFCFPKNTKNPNPSPIGKKFGFCCCGAPSGTLPRAKERRTGAFLPAGPAAGPSCSRHPMVHQIEPSLKDCNKKTRCNFLQRVLWCTISGRVKNSVQSACRPLRPPFCFAKPLVQLYAARGVHCSLPAFAHAQSWPLLTNPQPFLATSPRETNTSVRAKCESVPKGMVQQKSRNICCGFSWCTIRDSPAL